MPVVRPLDVGGSWISRFGARVRADVCVFEPGGVAVRETDAAAGRVPGREVRGVNLRFANIVLLLGVSIKRSFGRQRPSFVKHDKFQCVVSDQYGSVTRSPAILTVPTLKTSILAPLFADGV